MKVKKIPKEVLLTFLKVLLWVCLLWYIPYISGGYIRKDQTLGYLVIFGILLWWFLFTLNSIYKKIKLRTGKITNEMRIPTFKDQANLVLPTLLGVIICLIGGFQFFKSNMFDRIQMGLLFLVGVALIINAVIYLPEGIIRISKKKLTFINGWYKRIIGLDEFNEVTVMKDGVMLSHNGNEVFTLQKMNLKPEHYSLLLVFFEKQLGENAMVINAVEAIA